MRNLWCLSLTHYWLGDFYRNQLLWLASFLLASQQLILSSVQSLSPVWVFVAPWTAACQASQSIANSQSLLKLMSVESVMPSSHLILCHPFSSCLQSFPASGSFQMSQFFASGGQSIGVSASASVLPINTQGLISFRMDWLDLFAVQEYSPTPQFNSINASIN